MRAKLSLLYLSQIVPNTSQIAIDEKQILLEAVRLMISRNSYEIMSKEALASRTTRFSLLTTTNSPTTFTATTSILHVAGVVPIVRRHGIIEKVYYFLLEHGTVSVYREADYNFSCNIIHFII